MIEQRSAESDRRNGAAHSHPTPDERVLCLELPSCVRMVDVVDAFVSGVAASAGSDMDSIQDVQIAVREAVTNAIIHGNGRDVRKRVRVNLVANTAGLEICVQDQGRGFDPSEVPDPLAPDNLCKSSGRGILFMRSLMDEVSIVRDAEGGTQVRMAKRRARVARQPGAVPDAA